MSQHPERDVSTHRWTLAFLSSLQETHTNSGPSRWALLSRLDIQQDPGPRRGAGRVDVCKWGLVSAPTVAMMQVPETFGTSRMQSWWMHLPRELSARFPHARHQMPDTHGNRSGQHVWSCCAARQGCSGSEMGFYHQGWVQRQGCGERGARGHQGQNMLGRGLGWLCYVTLMCVSTHN